MNLNFIISLVILVASVAGSFLYLFFLFIYVYRVVLYQSLSIKRHKAGSVQVVCVPCDQKGLIFFLFLQINIGCGAHYKHVDELLLMSTHIIYFLEEIRKIFADTPSFV